MEIDPNPPAIAKKLWNIVRIMFFMLRKGISKSKLITLDLHMLLKRGKLAGKALTNLMVDHHHHISALSCRSNDVHLSFISPREYEFSCSNSPVYPSYYRRKNRHHNQYHRHRDDDVKVIQRVFDILNSHEVGPEASPLALPGFGKSPLVRQLRITDSPFPLKETEDTDTQVDMACEEFIKKFYKELKHQKKTAAVDSPSPYYICSG